MTGLFISLEGVDGVGKSTQAERLRDYVTGLGHRAVLTHEPGGTPLGSVIRALLLHGVDGVRLANGARPQVPDGSADVTGGVDKALRAEADYADIGARAEALLYAADRAQHVAQVVRPALEQGAIVISDRYIDSSLAYQAGGRELTPDDVRNLSDWATGGLWPRRTYLLDMDFHDSVARLDDEADRMESAGEEFFNRTRQAFLELAARDPQRFLVIDASRSVDDVWRQIKADMDDLIAQAGDGLRGASHLVTWHPGAR